MNIRPATESDAVAAAAVHSESATLAYADIFPADSTPPTPQDLLPSWLDLIDQPDTTVLVATEADIVVGAVAVVHDKSVPTGLLLARLYVRPQAWGRGCGSALHNAALAAAAKQSSAVNLWVLEANTKARALYERRGWALVPGYSKANDPPQVLAVLYRIDLR